MTRAALVLAALLAMPADAAAAFAANNLSCTIHAPKTPGLLARCEGPFSGPGGAITMELHGTAPNLVDRLKLKFSNQAVPAQELVLKAEPVVDLETVGVLFMDFNFDGMEDLAVMEFLPAGPNVPYLVYLFDPSSKKFRANAALSAIASPEVDEANRMITSSWRDGAARSGRDTYRWQEEELLRVSRTERTYTANGCRLRTYDSKDGKLVLTSEGECK